MSTNTFVRLRALLPPAPVLIAKVLTHNADETSTVELPLGLGNTSIATGVSVGTQMRARGTSVPVDANAFVRDGVIETRAPDGTPIEAVIGEVTEQPFGPERLAFAGPLAPVAGAVGVAYTHSTAAAWTGGFNPRVYSLTAGTLPAGLSLDGTSGQITGTPSAAGAATGLVIRCADSTHRWAVSGAFSLTVS